MSRGIGGAPPEQEDPRADLTWGTVPRLVDDAAQRHGTIEALVDGDRRLTYAQLAPEVDRYARGFVAAGVGAGERVAVWAPNCAEWMLAALGALRTGAVLVPLNTRFKGAEAAYIVRNAGVTTLLTVRGFLGADYPSLLAGEDTGALGRILVLRGEGDPSASGPSGVPILGLQEFLDRGSSGSVPPTPRRGRRRSGRTTCRTSSSRRAPPDTQRGRQRPTPSRCARSGPGLPSWASVPATATSW